VVLLKLDRKRGRPLVYCFLVSCARGPYHPRTDGHKTHRYSFEISGALENSAFFRFSSFFNLALLIFLKLVVYEILYFEVKNLIETKFSAQKLINIVFAKFSAQDFLRFSGLLKKISNTKFGGLPN
jgi:hypothetical protein